MHCHLNVKVFGRLTALLLAIGVFCYFSYSRPKFALDSTYDHESNIIMNKEGDFVVERAWVRGKRATAGHVTLCTQLSLDRWPVFLRQVVLWDGLVSASLFLRGNEDGDELLMVRQTAEALGLRVNLVRARTISASYPINSLRNIAIETAGTDYVMLVDVDFLPRRHMAARVAVTLPSLIDLDSSQPSAFVVPSFATDEDVPDAALESPHVLHELITLGQASRFGIMLLKFYLILALIG